MTTLCIMVKAPQMGRVKTRLARETGQAAAVAAYRTMLATIVRRLRGGREWRVVLAVAPDAAVETRGLPAAARIAQGRGDLGARMQRLFDRFRRRGPVIVIGSDIPGISRGDIRSALKALKANDAVVGPAEDGGYWLIGQGLRRRLAPFEGVRWSTEHARADTVRNLAGASVARLRSLLDVDAAQDWRAWTRESARVKRNGY
jgi:hypothetical protein